MTSYDMSSNAILAWSTYEVNRFCRSEEHKRPEICFGLDQRESRFLGARRNDSEVQRFTTICFPEY